MGCCLFRILSKRKNMFITVIITVSLFSSLLSLKVTIQVDVVEAETEDTLLRARRTTKRLSVTSLPSGLQKVKCGNKLASGLRSSQCGEML